MKIKFFGSLFMFISLILGVWIYAPNSYAQWGDAIVTLQGKFANNGPIPVRVQYRYWRQVNASSVQFYPASGFDFLDVAPGVNGLGLTKIIPPGSSVPLKVEWYTQCTDPINTAQYNGVDAGAFRFVAQADVSCQYPTNLSASCNNGSFNLNWTPGPGATSYGIRIKNDNTGIEELSTTIGNTTNYNWTPGSFGTNYTWWLHGINSTGWWSPASYGPGVSCPIPNGSVQGIKVLMPGNQNAFPAQDQPVSIDGSGANNDNPYGTGATFANPTYWNNLVAGSSHTISVPTVAGYSIGYTLCYNDTSCHDIGDPITPGNSVNITIPTTGSRIVDLWWHYTQNPPDIPGNPTDNACVNRDSRAKITWDRPAGATSFQIRVDEHNGTPSWNGLCNGSQNAGDICLDNVVISGNPVNYEFNVTGGKSYRWWVHACGPGGCGASSTERTFTGGYPAKPDSCPVPAPLPGNPSGKYGDVDGDLYVSCKDAEQIGKIVAGASCPISSQIEKADVDDTPGASSAWNCSTLTGDISSGDSVRVLRYIQGLDPTLPVCSVIPPTPIPTTAPGSKNVKVQVLIDNVISDGKLNAGESFGTPNVNFSSSRATIDQNSSFGVLPITSLFSIAGVFGPSSVTGSNYKYNITSGTGWQLTKYSSDKNLTSPACSANTTCDYSSGSTGVYTPAAGETVTYYLGIKPNSTPTPTTAAGCPGGQSNPHNACSGNSCVSTPGCGVGSCTSNSDCAAATYTIYIHAYLDEGPGACYHNKIQDCGETYPAPWRFATIGDPIVGNFNSYIAGGGSYTSGPLASGTWYAAIDYDTNLYELEDPISFPDSKTFTLGPNANINVPLLTIPTHSISGTIFIDDGAGGGTPYDGIKQLGEGVYPSTPVSMSVNGGTSSNRTLTSGAYTISGFAENQNHTINLTPPNGYVYSYSGADTNYVNPRTIPIIDTSRSGIDFGIVPGTGYVISGNVFIAGDNDCIQDVGEVNYAGATVGRSGSTANLGYDGIGTSQHTATNRILVSKLSTLSADQTLSLTQGIQGRAYIRGNTMDNGTVYMVIYNDSGTGVPGNLVAVSNGIGISNLQAAGWITFTFSSPFVSAPSTNLWLGIYGHDIGVWGGPIIYYSSSPEGGYPSFGYRYVNLADVPVPNPIGSSTAGTQRSWSAYLIVPQSPTSTTSVLGSPGYSFTSISAGTYNITLTTVPNGYTLIPSCTNPISIAVPPNTTTADFGLLPTNTISGNRVIDNDSSDTFNAGDTNMNVACTDCIKWEKNTGGFGTVSLSGTGTYSIPASPGTYIVTYNKPVPSGYKTAFPSPLSHSVTVGSPCDPGGNDVQVGASCSGGNVINLNFGFKSTGPWYQCIGCDLRIEDDDTPPDETPLEDPIPDPAGISACTNPYAEGAYATLAGAGGTHGVVFSGDSYEFGQGEASSTGWHVWNPDPALASIYSPSVGVLKTSYGYLIDKFRNEGYTMKEIGTSGDGSCGASGPTACAFNTANFTTNNNYHTNGNLRINNSVNFGTNANKKLVFMVEGDLIITSTFTIAADSKSSVTFIVKGDIHVLPNVGDTYLVSTSRLDGYFSTDQNFIIEGGAVCPTSDERLNISGAVVVNAARQGGDFVNNRSLCTNNSACPVLTVRERPDFVVNAPESIKKRPTVQKEVAP